MFEIIWRKVLTYMQIQKRISVYEGGLVTHRKGDH